MTAVQRTRGNASSGRRAGERSASGPSRSTGCWRARAAARRSPSSAASLPRADGAARKPPPSSTSNATPRMPPPRLSRSGLGERGVHLLLGHDLRRVRRDDRGRQAITGMEVRELRGGAVLDDLDPSLFHVTFGELLEALIGPDQEHRSRRLHDFAVLHLGHDDRRHRRLRRDGRRAFHARLQVALRPAAGHRR